MIRARTLGRRRNARRPSRSSSGDGGCLGGKGSRNGLELSSFFDNNDIFIYIYIEIDNDNTIYICIYYLIIYWGH